MEKGQKYLIIDGKRAKMNCQKYEEVLQLRMQMVTHLQRIKLEQNLRCFKNLNRNVSVK